MDELRASFGALIKKHGAADDARQRLTLVLDGYELAVAAVAALDGRRLAPGSAALDAVEVGCCSGPPCLSTNSAARLCFIYYIC
jgi:hypothetical protein